MKAQRALVLTIWLAGVLLAAIVVARARYISDLSAFLPANPTPAQQLLVDQLRDGPASRLILIAIEQGDAASRARTSLSLVERLRKDPEFSSVNNGEAVAGQRDREFLFRHRYLLSESVTAQRFTTSGLSDAIRETISNLASPGGLLFKSLLPRDPTGELLNILDQLSRSPAPQSRDGVWVSSDGARALAVVQTAANGSDSDAQSNAIQAIHAAFAAAAAELPKGPVAVQLRLSGPGVFAVAARAKIERAAIRLSMISSILVVTLLLAVYRSLPALALGLLPVATGALVGIAAVALGFGAVHGVTLGFGITMIGESVDYSIYFFIQSRRMPAKAAGSATWQQLWWPTILLGMLTSVCGFASLLPSGFPGLKQLGLYSISGLVAAALVTRYVLPTLLPAGFAIRDVTPLGARVSTLLLSAQRIRGRTLALCSAALVLIAAGVLYHDRTGLWNRELSALSPISTDEQNYDAKLRADLGAADVRDLVIVSGPDMESILRGAENAARALQGLADGKLIGGFDSPTNYLPSMATQESRRGSLPSAAELRANLKKALENLPLRAGLQPFLEDVEATRHAALVSSHDLAGTSLNAGFESLILHQKEQWNALLPLRAAVAGGAIDLAKVQSALESGGVMDARVLDLKQESDALYGSYLSEAIRFSLAGFLALTVLLLIALRSPWRVARVLAPLVLAVLTVAAGLAIAGVQMSILHLVGMLLIVAVGSNYALFFDRQAHAQEAGDPALTLASLVIANASTVIAFGLLSFSQVPVLVALGTTVAPGTFFALLFAAVAFRAGGNVHA
jgi:predicted exporter